MLKRLLATLFGPGNELGEDVEQACRHLLAVAAAAVDDRFVDLFARLTQVFAIIRGRVSHISWRLINIPRGAVHCED